MKNAFISPIYKPIRGEFFVPSFYKDFSCKGKECRNTCCSGWSVKIPMKEYFFLHGLNGSKDIREKLDKSIKPLQNRTQDKYAEIAFDFNNKCKLLSKEGWCILHQKYGENVLPSVCRYFPRGPRINYRWEASLSNGCERTVELLLENNEAIQYENKELVFYMPIINKEEETNKRLYIPVRNKCIDIIQNRNYALPLRILMIGQLLIGLDNGKNINDIDFTINKYKVDILFSYEQAIKIGRWFIENTGTFDEYFIRIESSYKDTDVKIKHQYQNETFMNLFPNYEIIFEKLLNNNIFYKQFPFQDYTNNFTDEFIALAGKYFILKYITINLVTAESTQEDLVDLWTRMFRTIAHTGFEKNIMILLKKMKLVDLDIIGKLIII